MRFTQSLLYGLVITSVIASIQANATTVFIDSTVSGCSSGGGACGNGVANLPPGATVNLISPETLTLGPGTYSITNAATTDYYSAWNFSGGWVWSFGITTDNGNGTGNVFQVGFVPYVYGSQTAAATSHDGFYGGSGGPSPPQLSTTGSAADFYNTFTLGSTTTLDFFTLDYYPYDNAGGVALDIEQVGGQTPLPAALPLFASGLGALSLLARRRKRKGAPVAA